MSITLLTGGAGAVGSAIVPRLLADDASEVRLLLRAESDDRLAARGEELFHFWRIADVPALRARVELMRGDAAEPRLGLGAEQYAGLVDECTHVIHCAGTVRMNLPLEAARRSAVGSARQIVDLGRRLAEGGRLRKIEYVSTVGIAGKRPGVLPESWVDEERTFHNTYEQAKAEAEDVMRRALVDEALPVTVHRPSMVVGGSQDGRVLHFQIFYFICELLSGRRTLGVHPDLGDVRLDIVPVDWVADAIVASSQAPETVGSIFHLCSGPDLAPLLEDLRGIVRGVFGEHGLQVPAGIPLPRAWFSVLARWAARIAPIPQRKALATLPVYLDYLADVQGFSNTRSRAWFGERGLVLPDPQTYLRPVLAHYLEEKYRASPSRS